MTTLSPVSLEVIEALESALPASPENIPANATLAELEAIRAGWLNQARAEQISERLFEIGRWLGAPCPTSYGDYRLWISGRLRIFATLARGLYDVSKDTWNITRSVTAYLDPAQQICVLSWSWSYLAQDIHDELETRLEGDKLLYVPGRWLSLALSHSEKAEQARIGFAWIAEAKERDALARRMLVGMEV
jgi:hypothetical protein